MNVDGEPAQERAEREEADCRGEDAARSEAVRHPAADGDEDGETQRVARQNSLHAEGGDVESFGHGGDGGIENGGVERFHEKRDRDEPGEQALTRPGRSRRLGGSAWRSGSVHWRFALEARV